MAVSGAQEIMVTEHCVLMAEGPCERRCGSCERRATAKYLLDRKGYRFPVRTDRSGRSHVYNSVPLDLVPSLRDVLDTGVRALRIDAQTLPAGEAAAQVRRVIAALSSRAIGEDSAKLRSTGSATTTGHFFRGVV
jgi:putative protease